MDTNFAINIKLNNETKIRVNFIYFYSQKNKIFLMIEYFSMGMIPLDLLFDKN